MSDATSRSQCRRLTLEPLEERSMLTSFSVDLDELGTATANAPSEASLALFNFDQNHAPTWADGQSPKLNAIEEDSANNKGTTVESLTTSVNDIDANSKKGVAVVSTPNENGKWQYTLNGGKKWTDFSATGQTARLLPANAGHSRVRFVPKSNFNGSVDLGLHAWDQTQGRIGSVFDVSANTGGSTAFSTASQNAELVVKAINDAPIWNSDEVSQLDPINEDQINNRGTPVWKLVTDVRDIDSGSSRGIAVVSTNGNDNGQWQYKLNRGKWIDFAATSQSARLLPANSRVRFVPNPNFHGTVPIDFRAWDQTQGTAGGTFDIRTKDMYGGDTAFSASIRQTNLAIKSLNDAPRWTTNQRPQLDMINEDNVTNRGTPVWKLATNVEDVDAGSKKGVAVVSTPDANGKWQYTLNGGKDWKDFSATSQSSRLLPANGGHSRLRFVPNLNFNGTVHLGLKAWDQTQGISGRTFDVSPGNRDNLIAAFSNRMLFSRLTVNPVNDAPVWAAGQSPQLGEIIEDNVDNQGTPVWKLVRNVDDVDSNSKKGIAVFSTPGGRGKWEFSLDGGKKWNEFSATRTAARLLPANSRVRLVPNSNFHGSVKLRFFAWDQSQGQAGGTFAIPAKKLLGGNSAFSANFQESVLSVKPQNDAPIWRIGLRPKFDDIFEDDANNQGTAVRKLVRGAKDFDADSRSGIAVTESNSSNGKWQYKLDRGDWTDLVASSKNARLLPVDSYVRFVPEVNFHGTAQLAFHAWDQTQGKGGRTFDIASSDRRGGSTAFSSDPRYSFLTVQPQNDAPVLNSRTSPPLDGIDINDFDSPGTRVLRLIEKVTDVDDKAKKGIAVINASRENGWWQYRLHGGEWTNFTASSSIARLLPPNSHVRFVPNPGFVGTVVLQYRAWDQTQGQPGGTYSLPPTERLGGKTAFSLGSQESTLSVGPV